jgi:hypothetical protein
MFSGPVEGAVHAEAAALAGGDAAGAHELLVPLSLARAHRLATAVAASRPHHVATHPHLLRITSLHKLVLLLGVFCKNRRNFSQISHILGHYLGRNIFFIILTIYSVDKMFSTGCMQNFNHRC